MNQIVIEYTVYNSDGTHKFNRFCSIKSIHKIVEKHEKKGHIINYGFKIRK